MVRDRKLGCTRLADSGIMPPMKYWEIVADKLSAAGWSWGYCSAVTRNAGVGSLTPHREGAATLSILTSCRARSWSWKRRCCDTRWQLARQKAANLSKNSLRLNKI